MNITKNQIDDLNATIKIELGKEDYAGRVEKALKDYQKKVVVNGFRPGKTPMGIVKKMYGKSLLVDEINKVLGESLNNYIKENNLQILGEPLPNETEQKELNLEDENFEFLYDIALSPEVNAKMSKREKIPFYTIKVDDEMIDKQIESICKNNGNMIAVDEIEGTEYLKGELIELDADGNVKEGGIKNEDASMSVFHMKDEEAVNAFKGKKAGEEVKFNAVKAYPNKTDFAAMLGVTKEEAEHAGENYCFIVKEIKRYIDAEVNEELFTKLYGEGVVKDAADFRNRVKADIENQLKGHSEYRFTIDAKEKLIKKNEDVVLPETFLKRWIVAVNEKMTPEEVEKDFEGYRDEFKWQLVKSAIVKDYDVKVEAEHAGENYCFIVKEIKRYIDAEVNEELFTKLYGEGVVKDAADFRNRVKADIENQLKGHSEYRFTIDAKEKLIKKNEDVVLPETFLKRWIVAVNEKMTPEEVEKDFEGYRDEFKWQLVKSAIVKDYDVKVEAEDMKREGRQIAAAQLQQYGLYGLTDEQLDGFAAKLLEDEKQRQHLYERALDNKVFDVIRENVKLEEQEISMADFEKLFQK